MFDALIAWLTHPSTWITVLVVGGLGETIKALVLGPKKSWPRDPDGTIAFTGWKGVYVVTYKIHALPVTGALGLIPGIPVIEAMQSDGIAGAVLQYLGNGALAMVLYAVVVGTLKSAVEVYGARLLKVLGGGE